MLNMEYSPERGKEKRQAQIEPVVLTDKTAGNHCYAKLNYMSCHAMYFETECAFKPGTMIDIQFDKPPLKGASMIYSATVHWCMLLSMDESISKYGIGVKYFEANNFKPGMAVRLILSFKSNQILITG
jgi:hypothetical protein